MSLITAPSMFHCWLVLLPIALNDVCWPDRLPPTFDPLISTPGVCSRMTHGSRADGILSSASLLKLAEIAVDRVSTTGLSPLTVTVSWTVEMSILVSISALKPAWMTTPSRIVFLKPASSNATV